MYMDDIRVFSKNENELEALIQAMRIYSEERRMDFSIEKCAMLIMKNRTIEGIELLNQEKPELTEKKKLINT